MHRNRRRAGSLELRLHTLQLSTCGLHSSLRIRSRQTRECRGFPRALGLLSSAGDLLVVRQPRPLDQPTQTRDFGGSVGFGGLPEDLKLRDEPFALGLGGGLRCPSLEQQPRRSSRRGRLHIPRREGFC